MSGWEESLAFIHAPILLQKTIPKYSRSDFITRVDFAYDWKDIYKNWGAVWEKKQDGSFLYRLNAHGYYSVVETHTHYFIVYAFYHPQDWSAFWGDPGDPTKSDPSKIDQHLHDMEGALAIVPKREHFEDERIEALITISHFHFYSYAGWEDSEKNKIPGPYLITGWTKDLDGAIQVSDRYSAEPGEPKYRFKLYAASGSHAIKGLQKDWGDEKNIIRYRPSLQTAEEPTKTFSPEEDASFQETKYKLISVFEVDGLWAQVENSRVIQPNNKGQQAFVIKEGNKYRPGSANPPWGWDDYDDRHKPGEFAWDPAHLVNDYFNGLREFSREYIHNPYIGIVKS